MEAQRARNTSNVKDPKWTGRDGEPAIVVSRGEPRRTDEQMREVVADQVERYLVQFGDRQYVAEVHDLAVELIAEDYIDKPGSQAVILMREHLLAYVHAAVVARLTA